MSQTSAPFFALAMPAYNAAATIGKSIESVLAQDFSNWELVICNDGSTDETLAVAESHAKNDSRITIITQENEGCGAARDSAVRASRAPWVVRFDSDDVLFPHYLSSMKQFIERSPGYDIYSCNGVHLYPDGSRRRARPGHLYNHETSFSYDDMLTATHIFTIAVFSRDLFDRVGGINRSVYCEDVEFWLRSLALGAKHRYTPQELAYYTVSRSQMSSDFSKIVQSRVAIYRSLIESGTLTPQQERNTQKAILRVLQDESIYNRRTRFIDGVSKVLGSRASHVVSSGLHHIGRPIRIFQKKFPRA